MHDVDITGPLAADVATVRSVANEIGLTVWLVGGPVRDALLGREISDLDFLVEKSAGQIAAAVSRRLGGSVRLHPAFMTAKVLRPAGGTIDFTTARTEEYPRPGSLPVVREASVEADLIRRDFAINAIAWDPVASVLLDPADGLGDLERGVIRILHDRSFLDDPTRIFRAVRFAARLRFDIEPETERRLREALEARALTTVSPERLWREFSLCLREPDPSSVLERLARHEVLQEWLGASSVDPALRTRLSLLDELCRESEGIDEEVLYLATLLEALTGATPPAGTGFSRPRTELLDRLVRRTSDRLRQWTSLETEEDRARFCLELTEEEAIVLALRLEDPHETVKLCRGLHALRLPFDGHDLAVSPGPHVGRALKETRIRVWLGTIPPGESLEFARRAALRYLREAQT